jgi:hypothetical protein
MQDSFLNVFMVSLPRHQVALFLYNIAQLLSFSSRILFFCLIYCFWETAEPFSRVVWIIKHGFDKSQAAKIPEKGFFAKKIRVVKVFH